jgi:hypothetical protein
MNRTFSTLLFTAIIADHAHTADEAAPQSLKRMTLDSFAQTTINVLRDDGISEYLPTIVLTGTQEIRTIQGIPATIDHRTAIQNVIRRAHYESKEFFFGVRSTPETLTAGHYRPGKPTEFMTIAKIDGEYSTKPLSTCDWWTIQ